MNVISFARFRRVTRAASLFVTTLAAAAAGAALALPPQPARGPDDAPRVSLDPPLVQKLRGEGEAVRRRHEWFFSTRRAGADGRMLELRRDAADRLRKQLEFRAPAAPGTVAASSWVPRGPATSRFGNWSFGRVSGRVIALAQDRTNGILYAGGASGGLWKSTNDGLSWTPLLDAAGSLSVGTITVDPNNASVLWVGTGENSDWCEEYFGIGLLRSTDGGATWQKRNGTGNALDLSAFASVIVDPRDSNHLVVGGRYRGCVDGNYYAGGIYTSTDAGANWTMRLSATVTEVVQDPQVRNTYWAGTGSGVYRSTDNGLTWIQQTGLPTSNTGRVEVAIAPSNSQVVYALFSSANGTPAFYRTTDGGTNWTQMSSGTNACDGQCTYNMVLRVHPTTPTTVYRGTIHIFKSTDGGANWSDLSNAWGSTQKVHQDTHEFLLDPLDGNKMYVGCDGGVWKTTDGGTTFTNLNGNLSLTQFYSVGIHPTDNDQLLGGAQDNSSLARTTEDTWDLQQVTGDGFVTYFDPVDPTRLFIASYPSGGYPAVYRSTSGTWGPFTKITGSGSGIAYNDRIAWVTPHMLDPTRPQHMFLGTHRAYRSLDGGSTWTQVGPTDMTSGGNATVSTLEVNRGFADTVYAGTSDTHIWKSADGGSNWTDISTGLPAGHSVNDVAGDPADAARALAVVGGFNSGHLFEYTGTTWTQRGTGLPNVPANSVLFVSSTEVYVATDVGVYQSTDGGANFAPFMNGLPQGLVMTDLKYNATTNTLTAATYGRGAWQYTLSGVPNVRYHSVVLPMTEVDGDHDGNVEPGETWKVWPVLQNTGGATATNVRAVFSTATPGVTVTGSSVAFGSIGAGAHVTATTPVTFTVDPSFTCGGNITFDLTSITSNEAPGTYPDQPAVYTVTVIDSIAPDQVLTLVSDNLDPMTATWTSNVGGGGGCGTPVNPWRLASHDGTYGNSLHAGNGPGTTYPDNSYGWLFLNGVDSENGAGVTIPANATAASLTFDHWYAIEQDWDGGHVLADSTQDGTNSYGMLTPVGGYPGSISTSSCAPLAGFDAYTGNSGWTGATFDLLGFAGKKIWLAWIFDADSSVGYEGWYIDNVKVQATVPGGPVCQVTHWPGTVPPTVAFAKTGALVRATWPPACNAGSLPGQTYAIQRGDLGQLLSGTYTHAPLGGKCDYVSPATFTPGTGNEYYLVTSEAGGREGSAGTRSSGAQRPHPGTACGTFYGAEACP